MPGTIVMEMACSQRDDRECDPWKSGRLPLIQAFAPTSSTNPATTAFSGSAFKIYAVYEPKKYKRNKLCRLSCAGTREIHAQPVRGKRAAKVIFSLRSGSGVNEAVMLVFNPVRPKRAASRPFRCEFWPQVAIRCRLNGGASAATAAELIDLDGYK
jgi:hypothetical protein